MAGACLAGGVHGGGGEAGCHTWQGDIHGRANALQGRGACIFGGVHGRRTCVAGVCMALGVCGRGNRACIAKGVHGRGSGRGHVCPPCEQNDRYV